MYFSHFAFTYRRGDREISIKKTREALYFRETLDYIYIYIYIYTYTNGIKVELKSSHVKSRVYLEGYLSLSGKHIARGK